MKDILSDLDFEIANETAEFLVIVPQRRFICTVINSVYNGSKFRLTPSVWPEKAHDSIDVRGGSILQSQKITFFEQN